MIIILITNTTVYDFILQLYDINEGNNSILTEKTRLQLEIAFNQSTSQKIVEQCWEIPQLSQITTLLTQLSKNKTNMSL